MTIAIIEDQEEIRYSIKKVFQNKGFIFDEFDGSEPDIVASLFSKTPDLIILDVMLGKRTGIEILEQLRAQDLNTPVILITAYATSENIIQASRYGVKDILQKPFHANELERIIHQYSPLPTAQTSPHKSAKEGELVGSFETMGNVYQKIGLMASNTLNVLLLGETGTGKELAAKLIHKFSNRHTKPFIALNCAAIPQDLFESQFFGHEKGAFTGADTLKIGHIELAQGGTLFLDEIGEMPLGLQGKLLRFLETRTFRRLGGKTELVSEAKIITATNVDLLDEIRTGRFREDLYFRLSQLTLELLPLRKRRDDIPALVEHFIAQASHELHLPKVVPSKEALTILRDYPFPGNIRELKNTVYSAMLNARGTVLQPHDFLLPSSKKSSSAEGVGAYCEHLLAKEPTLSPAALFEKIEREFLAHMLQKHQGNLTKLSQALNLSRNTLKARLHKLGL